MILSSSRIFIVVAVVVAPMSALGTDTSSDALAAADFLDLEQVSGPQISPDGNWILSAGCWMDRMEDRRRSDAWVTNVNGTRCRVLSTCSSPRWAPDRTRFAFLEDREPAGTQIFVRWLDAAEATKITRVDGEPPTIRWSPHEKSTAFVLRTDAEERREIDISDPPEGEPRTARRRIVEGV